MTKAAAKEVAHLGVRVNAIQPGLIRSAMTEAMPQRIWDSKVAEVPMGRAGEPDEVANVALFLASDLSSYMTGTVLEVTGGRYMLMRESMRDAVICEPVRTPIGRYGGMFKSLTAVDLGVAALKGLLARTGIAPDAVEDVILGHCYPSSEAPAIGRVVALDAGLPVTVPGMQIDRRCGSGLQAVIQACLQVASGNNDLVVAGGAESMSNVVFHSTDMRWGGARGGVTVHDALARGPHHRRRQATTRCPAACWRPPRTCAASTAIPREEQDELAVRRTGVRSAAQKRRPAGRERSSRSP